MYFFRLFDLKKKKNNNNLLLLFIPGHSTLKFELQTQEYRDVKLHSYKTYENRSSGEFFSKAHTELLVEYF